MNRAKRSSPGVDRGVGVLGRGDLVISLILILPLFLAYEIGVLFLPGVNGLDFFSRWLFDATGGNRQHYVAAQLGIAAAFVIFLAIFGRRRGHALESFVPTVLESAIYALTLGTLIVFLMGRIFGMPLVVDGVALVGALEHSALAQSVVVSLGAGVYEELIFRLGVMGMVGVLLLRAGLTARSAALVGAGVAALLFAAAHHVGAYGEAWDLAVFTYRALAGLAFAAIFYFRSLAHAVYSHFLYDLYVLTVQS